MHPKLICIAITCLTLFSCNQHRESASSEQQKLLSDQIVIEPGKTDGLEQIPTENKAPLAADTSSPAPPVATSFKPAPVVDWDKKIVKTASIKIEVQDFKSYNETIHRTAKQYGAYVASEQQNIADDRNQSVITFKVPVDQFDDLMNQLPGNEKTLERNVSTDDVTAQVTDVKSRLAAKKQVWLKYLDFLKDSKNMEEALRVQTELNGIHEEMEAAEGRIKLLTHQSAMSTITLTFFQIIPGINPHDPSPTFFERIKYAVKSGAGWVGDLIVALLGLWPFLILIPLAVFGIKKFTANKKAAV